MLKAETKSRKPAQLTSDFQPIPNESQTLPYDRRTLTAISCAAFNNFIGANSVGWLNGL